MIEKSGVNIVNIADGITITVILPVFNGENFIESILQSLTVQTFPDFQVIIIDDGSTDKTRELCEKKCEQDKRFICVRQDNAGVSAARNRGLKLASGKYITYVDADDWLEKDTLKLLVELAEEHKADVVFCQSIRQNVVRPLDPQKTGTVVIAENENVLKYNFGNIRKRSMAFFRNDILKDLYFDESIKFSEDVLFIIKALAKAKKVVSESTILYHYYQHPDSTLHKKQGLEFFVSNVNAQKQIYEIIKDRGISSEDKQKYYLDFCISVFSLLRYGAKADNEKVFRSTCEKYEQEIHYCLTNGKIKIGRKLKFASYYYLPFWLVKLLHGRRKYDVKGE